MEDNNYCTIYLARHAETENNVKNIIQGHLDSPLSELGNQQIAELGEHFKDMHFDAVFSSDIMRAKITAEAAVINKKLAVNTTHLLRERFFGSYEGKTFEEYRKDNEEMIEKVRAMSLKEGFSVKLYDDYESTEEMLGRMFTFFREIAVTYAGKTVLVVSHGAIISSLMSHLGFPEKGTIWINNTGYVVLRSDGVDFFLDKTHNVEIVEKKLVH